jgi:hypothetical protein
LHRHAWVGHAFAVGRFAWRAWVIVHLLHWPL